MKEIIVLVVLLTWGVDHLVVVETTKITNIESVEECEAIRVAVDEERLRRVVNTGAEIYEYYSRCVVRRPL
jgi:hypothetical protein